MFQIQILVCVDEDFSWFSLVPPGKYQDSNSNKDITVFSDPFQFMID
jgi:hypothetical protein